jgi:2',3'-cyclic-nucleotide 2'-phosphodiesterase (5'-nucleotidase family)
LGGGGGAGVGRPYRVVGWRYTEHPLTPDQPADPAVAAVVAAYRDALDLALSEVVGTAAVPLDARAAPSRARETNLGNLIADALRDWGAADVGLQNGGGIRSDRVYDAGPLSRRDLAAILPFANYAAVVRLAGAALRDALEHSVAATGEGAGRFLQVSGLAFAYDPSAPPGSRVRDVRVGDRPLDPAAAYTVALNDFLAGGGDQYAAFAEAEVLVPAQAGPLITTVVADYVAAHGTVAPHEEGRIRTTSDE